MLDNFKKSDSCCSDVTETCIQTKVQPVGGFDSLEMLPLTTHGPSDEACCGAPPGPSSGPNEKPGYTICHFVEDFIVTQVGSIPRVKTKMDLYDFWGTCRARSGLGRNTYSVVPGLYAVGNPEPEDAVLVTANYKLSFDQLRKELKDLNLWVLVLDTRSINVWCAAGKGLFSTQEVVRKVKETRLEKLVNHRKLILPQLSATGVSAQMVKKSCGFEVVWGPIRTADIKQFLQNRMKASEPMRRVTFSTTERLILVPVELSMLWKPTLWAAAVILAVSGIGPGFFSLQAAIGRGGMLLAAFVVGVFTGTVLTPAVLPWIPGKAFSVKGAVSGFAGALAVLVLFRGQMNDLEMFTLLLTTLAVSSYLAMNFTGSTPFTSPSGVEKEMRGSLPFQAAALVFAVIFWIAGAFK